MKQKLVNIVGIDGAGKTTLAISLAEKLKERDKQVSYKYCQYFAKLLYPIKFVAKLSVMRKTDEFKNYNNYNETKKQTSSRYPKLANIYATFWLIDYIIQMFFKVTLFVIRGKKLIVDRYIFDIAVNLSLTTNNDISYAKKIVKIFFLLSPKPELTIFIDIPEEVAFERKDDIQDIEYLAERRERYLMLAKDYQFVVINGNQSPAQVLKVAFDLVKN